jgi:hypothetical protein
VDKTRAVPGFRRGLRARCLEEAVGRLTSIATRAAETLAQLLDSESETIKLRAAVSLLEQLIRVREHSEIAARLAALERRVKDEPRPRLAN